MDAGYWIRVIIGYRLRAVHRKTKDLDVKSMKYILFLTFLIASHLPVFSELSKDELKQFKSELEIAGVRVETWKSEDRNRYERLEVNTIQSDDDPFNYDMSRFRIRMVVELTDRQKNTYLVQFTGNAPADRDSEYLGEDYWRLYMAHEEFDRLKVTAHYIQYGIMDDETFVPLAEDKDNVDEMLERVRKRETVLFPGKVYVRHYYIYNDMTFGGGAESTPVNVRRIKE
jgi:hypothetical protein